MTKFEGKTITGSTFVIEESFFLNCVLRDCDLFYSGGDFEWANIQFDNCRWHFRGPAQKTMQLFQTIGLLTMPQTPPQSQVNKSKMN